MEYTREGRAVTYVHYGHEEFDTRRFEAITNFGNLGIKPNGGLWASPVLAGDRVVFIDFEKMLSDGWDALEISLTNYWRLYDLLYGWDCDSIVVLNRDAVVPV